jgi:hypothetical protein
MSEKIELQVDDIFMETAKFLWIVSEAWDKLILNSSRFFSVSDEEVIDQLTEDFWLDFLSDDKIDRNYTKEKLLYKILERVDWFSDEDNNFLIKKWIKLSSDIVLSVPFKIFL